MKNLKVERILIEKPSDFLEVRDLWHELENGKDMTAFQSYAWNELLVEEYFADAYNRTFSKLYVYYVVREECPVLLAPLIVQKHTAKLSWWGRRKGIYLLGLNSYSDYMNFVYQSFEEETADLLLKAIREHFYGLPFYFNYIRKDTDACEYLIDRKAEILAQTTSVYVSLCGSADVYLSSLSKSTKQNLRTAKNRMVKDSLEYVLETGRELQNTENIDTLLYMHDVRAMSKNSKRDVDFLHRISRILMTKYRTRKEKKYNIIAQSMKRMHNSYFVTVSLNGNIVSYLYGLTDQKAYRIMQNCFDEEYKFYSPMFKGAFDFISKECDEGKLGVSQIDFTRGDEEYKLKLAGKEVPLYHFVIR